MNAATNQLENNKIVNVMKSHTTKKTRVPNIHNIKGYLHNGSATPEIEIKWLKI